MAQFDKNKEQLMLNNRHLYEVVMTADKDGNIINNGGSLVNINLAAGLVEGYSAINKFGFNVNLGNNGFESIWDGSNLYAYPTNATVAAVTGDAPGAVISIQGLDENYNLIVEAVAVGSSSIAQFIRVFRASVIVPPTGADTNEHDITITVDSIVAAKILADNGQTLMAIYTVPAGKTGYLTKLQCSVDKSTDVKYKLMAKPFNGAFNVKGQFGTFGVPFEYEYTVPLRFTEKTDIEIRAQSGNTCGAGAIFDIILIDNV